MNEQIENNAEELFLQRKLDGEERYFETHPVDQRYKMVSSVFLKAERRGGDTGWPTLRQGRQYEQAHKRGCRKRRDRCDGVLAGQDHR